MRERIKSVVGAVCVLTALNVAPGASSAAERALSWVDCGDGLQCAAVTVPADWGDRDGARIDLGLAKLPARDLTTKKGVLLVDLGGPAQQISVVRHVKEAFTDLTRWFDVVLWDPRGFEASAGVECPNRAPLPGDAVWASPDRAAYEEYRARNHRFGVECGEAAGPLAGKLDSWQVAHDMDAIRAALGEARLNYFGNSYGTVFAQAYAESFPRRIGRMYLDSVLDHTTRSWSDWLVRRARVMERNLVRFAEWCAGEPGCALHGRDVLTVWDEVIARATGEPIPARDGTRVSAALILSRTNPVFEEEWPDLARALAGARAGDATLFAEQPLGSRDPDLSRIMMCADFPYPSDHRVLASWEAELRRTTPRIGYVEVWPMAYHCGGLPTTGTYPPRRLHPRDLPPILVASGEHDNTTPPQDARRVAAQLGSARYLPVQGGHALYLSGHPCVREHVHRYLTTGALPPEGTACGAA